jgi:hypothetical protein
MWQPCGPTCKPQLSLGVAIDLKKLMNHRGHRERLEGAEKEKQILVF